MTTRELNPASSSLTNSQARESAEVTGVCSDGVKCGFAGVYCDDCPNLSPDTNSGQSEVVDSLEKQARYQDAKGDDWIDEFARTATADEFRGAMRFTIGKYLRRAGKKDPLPSEIRKMRDYCQRWEAYELALRESGQ